MTSLTPRTRTTASSPGDDDQYPTAQDIEFPAGRTPYPQQLQLMDALLKGLQYKTNTENSRIVVLESPTGTGKSLAVASAALAWYQWQRHQDDNPREDSVHPTGSPSKTAQAAIGSSTSCSPTGIDWVDQWEGPTTADEDQKDAHQKVVALARETRDQLTRHLARMRIPLEYDPDDASRNLQRRLNHARHHVIAPLKRQARHKRKRSRPLKAAAAAAASATTKEQDFCLSPMTRGVSGPSYESEEENAIDENYNDDELAPLLEAARLDGSAAVPRTAALTTSRPRGIRKILYAARTHSQLSQFLAEVQKLPGGRAVRAIAVGSRTHLCGHFSNKSMSEAQLTEACLDLNKSSTQKCPYKQVPSAISALAGLGLAQPTNVEEWAQLGKATQTCAYYAARAAVAAAELVVLPYAVLVHPQARAAWGLDVLEGCLIVVDEAHNLPEAIRSISGATLSLSRVQAAQGQLQAYVQRYRDRLAARHLDQLRQLSKILTAFSRHLSSSSSLASTSSLLSSSELILELGLETINLFPLLRYMKETKLSQKLLGFWNAKQQQQQAKESDVTDPNKDLGEDSEFVSRHVSPMSIVETFLERLSGNTPHGKVVVESDSKQQYRFVLLHPAEPCQALLRENPYGLVLCGGTLSPLTHLASELFWQDSELTQAAQAADQQIAKNNSGIFQCGRWTCVSGGHVVSSERVLLQAIGSAYGTNLDFRQGPRGSPATMRALGRTLVEISRATTRGGLVVFLPSYKYEKQLKEYWKSSLPSVWNAFLHEGESGTNNSSSRKPIFWEPKSSAHVDGTLEKYSRAAMAPSGAVLFSVIGGKLSEGINFANDLGRTVVVVGLPYGDPTDPVLKEKQKLLNQEAAKNGGGLDGRAYYFNLCMRAVNQSVGRAIRHARDYAAVVLIDKRYQTDQKVRRGLPRWLADSTRGWDQATIETTRSAMNQFFNQFEDE